MHFSGQSGPPVWACSFEQRARAPLVCCLVVLHNSKSECALPKDLIHAVTAHWDHARQMEEQVGDAVVNVTRELVREHQACLRCDQAAAVRYKIVPP